MRKNVKKNLLKYLKSDIKYFQIVSNVLNVPMKNNKN